VDGHAAVVCAQGGLGAAHRHGGHAQGLAHPAAAQELAVALVKRLAATAGLPGCEAHAGDELLLAFEPGQIGADLAADGLGGLHGDAVDARGISAAHAEERLAQGALAALAQSAALWAVLAAGHPLS